MHCKLQHSANDCADIAIDNYPKESAKEITGLSFTGKSINIQKNQN